MRPVVALDIDGTLGDYHGHFTRFAEQWIGRPLPDPAAINPGLPLYRHLGISRATYRQCKLAYRQGGLKRSMPAYEGADLLSRMIRKSGAQLWICTTRPYLRLDNIDPDTRHWLRRNGIQHDGVLFGPNKYLQLSKLVDPSCVVMVLDDLPEMCVQASRYLGPYVAIRDQPYNQHYQAPTRVWTMEQAGVLFQKWRAEVCSASQ